MERACAAGNLHEVLVATDDERIYHEAESFGGKVMMTSVRSENGERSAALKHGKRSQVTLISREHPGDEPFIDPEAIDDLVLHMQRKRIISLHW